MDYQAPQEAFLDMVRLSNLGDLVQRYNLSQEQAIVTTVRKTDLGRLEIASGGRPSSSWFGASDENESSRPLLGGCNSPDVPLTRDFLRRTISQEIWKGDFASKVDTRGLVDWLANELYQHIESEERLRRWCSWFSYQASFDESLTFSDRIRSVSSSGVAEVLHVVARADVRKSVSGSPISSLNIFPAEKFHITLTGSVSALQCRLRDIERHHSLPEGELERNWQWG